MLKIAFIGCGYVVSEHVNALRTDPEVKIAAFSNPHLESAQKAAGQYGAQAFADYREMVEKIRPDAVFVCVPPAAHTGQEDFLAERGIPMLVEKPLGLNLESVSRTGKLIEKKNVLAAAGYLNRYLPITDRVKELIKGRKVIIVRGCWASEMPGPAWWRKRDTCGGQIVEQSTHTFDLLRFLFGEVEKVQGFCNSGAKRDRSDYDVEDSSSVNLLFRNGIVGNVCSAIYSPPKGAFHRITVICDGLICTMSLFDGKLLFCDEHGMHEENFPSSGTGFLLEDQAFLHAVRTGDCSGILSGYQDGVKSLNLTFAAMESLRNGNRVVQI